MSLISNKSNVSFATELPIDKIVGVYVGGYENSQTTTLGGFLYQYAIPHGFGRPVFCDLLWSIDGVNYADGGSGLISGNSGVAYSDSNNIYVTTTYNAGSIQYKVIATWIDYYDTSDPAISPELSTVNNFYFDSRKNYQKIYQQGSETVSGTSGSFSRVYSLDFNPNVKVFFEAFPGQVWPSIGGGLSNPFLYDFALQYECETTNTSSSLTVTLSGGGSSVSSKAWYRVYLDD
jgi:hypothetical protein